MKRLLALMLAIFMVLCMLVACDSKDSKDDDDDETKGTGGGLLSALVGGEEATDSTKGSDFGGGEGATDSTLGLEEPSEEENPAATTPDYSFDEYEEFTDYGGYEFRILTQGSTGGEHWSAYEFYYDDGLVGDSLNDAVIKRDNDVGSLHNIKISYVEKGFSEMTDYVKECILSGSDEFDVISHNLSGAATLAQESMLINLRDYDDILNLDEDHWDQSANDGLDINGHLYFTCSDLTLTDKQASWVVYFTKAMFEKYPNLLPEGYDSIYDMVEQGDWTIEQMYNMVKAVSKDNGDGVWNNLDTYGHFGESFSVQALMIGCGARGVEKTSTGYRYVLGDNAVSLAESYEKVYEIVNNEAYSMLAGNMAACVSDVWVDGAGAMMEKNQVLFNITGMNRCRLFRNLEADFGIIPAPKANSAQADYSVIMTGVANCVAIPINAADKVRSCEILETLTRIASDTTYKAYIEQSLAGKYLRDDESEAMLEIIFDSRYFDVSEVYRYNNLSFGPSSVFTMNPKPEALSSTLQRQQNRNKKALERFLADMEGVFEATARK